MKKLIMIITLLSLVSCASTLLPVGQRKVSIVKKTSKPKGHNYSKAMSYFAKAFKDSSKVIKSKDKGAGQIILKGNTSCNIFRQAGDINNYSLMFTLTFDAKDKKVRFLFEDLFIASNIGEPVAWGYNQLSSAENVKKSKKCLANLVSGVVESISDKSDW
jgi:hypothetical protein